VAPQRGPGQERPLLLLVSIRRLLRQALGNAVVLLVGRLRRAVAGPGEVLKLPACLLSGRRGGGTFWVHGTRLLKKRNGADWPLDSIRAAACPQQETWSFPA